MPRDGSGVYTLPAGNPVVTNTVIASAWANSTLSDIAAQLNNVFTRDGTLGPTGPFKIMDGTVNAPGLAWNSEPGLGWYRSAASVVGFAAQGTQVTRLDASVATSTFHLSLPRAAGTATFYARNGPLGAVNYNQVQLAQNADGSAILATQAAGTATRGTLSINAPYTSVVGGFAIDTSSLPGSNASIQLVKNAATNASDVYGVIAPNVARWLLRLGNGNATDDFAIHRYDDAGAIAGTSLVINRSNGAITFPEAAGISVAGTLGANVLNANEFNTSSATGGFRLQGGNAYFVQDANYVYHAMSAGWYWAWAKANGNLIWAANGVATTFNPTGDFTAGRSLYCGGGAVGLIGTGNPHIQFTADNWRLEWAGGNLTYYNSTSAVLHQINNAGDLSVGRNFQANGSVAATGNQIAMINNTITCNSFGNSSGNIFSNMVGASPGGMFQCLSFQHTPGTFAAMQMQVGGNNFTFNSSGVANCNGGWQSSDRKTKHNITALPDAATAAVMAIPVSEWDRIGAIDEATGKELHQVGWVAQDVQPHFPKAIYTQHRTQSLPALEEGGETRLEILGSQLTLDPSAMTALLWKAFQELINRVTALETT